MGTTPDTRTSDHPRVILRYLRDLWRQQKPLLFSFDNDPREKVHEARIQKLDPEAGHIILRMLLPPGAGSKAEFSGSISARSRLEYGQLFFSTSLDTTDESDLPGQCVMLFPARVSKEQLRSAYRVSLVQHENRVVIIDSDGREFPGTSLDLSVGGLLFQVDGDADIPRGIGQEFDYCHVNLVGMLDFTCRATVRRCVATGTSKLLLGLSFDELTEQHVKELSRVLARLERNSLRQKLHRGDDRSMPA